jgi:hypothetical protein
MRIRHHLLRIACGSALLVASSANAVIDASLQMQLGNPSGATADTNNHDHYLIQRTVEALDYSDHFGEPVWASWDLTTGGRWLLGGTEASQRKKSCCRSAFRAPWQKSLAPFVQRIQAWAITM